MPVIQIMILQPTEEYYSQEVVTIPNPEPLELVVVATITPNEELHSVAVTVVPYCDWTGTPANVALKEFEKIRECIRTFIGQKFGDYSITPGSGGF